MLNRISQLTFNNGTAARTPDFTMGLETGTRRVDEDGSLNLEPCPPTIGDREANPWTTSDPLETMAEMVIPSAQHILDAMHYLYAINNTS